MNWFLGWDWAYFATLVKSKGTSEADDIMRDKEITLRLTQVKRPTQCLAFSEENLWVIPNTEYGIPYRPGDRGKIYSQALLNDNSLWLNAAKDKNGGNAATDNIATYHNVSSGKKVEGFANVVFVDGHVEAIKGLAGYDAYYEYGRPYNGHENIDPIW
jgi:prepilin-type processing-associated H-X9-DG protein